MKLLEFLADDEWDAPFFKLLAHNDTGQASGHQAGMVLPKDLRGFLPTLDEGIVTQVSPTTDRHLRVELFIGTTPLGESIIRYQLQTWGGTRSAESRITDGFQAIRDAARENDVIIFQRKADALDRFRLILVPQTQQDLYGELSYLIGQRRWGPLRLDDIPLSQTQLTQVSTEVLELSQKPFQVVQMQIARVETRQTRIARRAVFRERVRREYHSRCAVSGISVTTPTLLHEVECAHIVPVSAGGSDDIRNGITLTQTLHWAFDRGLFGVMPNRTIYIPRKVSQMAENEFLRQFENKTIIEAEQANSRAHGDAFSWHMNKFVRRWD
jgi:putative restriction endonuclease